MIYQKNVDRIERLVEKQNEWRLNCLNLIASENVMSNRARNVMGSDFCHRYAEGHPGERYYQGTEIIDEVEMRVKQHLKSLFDCKHIDVRPISGTIANLCFFVNIRKRFSQIFLLLSLLATFSAKSKRFLRGYRNESRAFIKAGS